MERWNNWAGNERATAARVVRPTSRDEIVAAVCAAAAAGESVKAVGAGHSFTPAAVTDGVRIELDRYADPVSVSGRSVTVHAGMPLHRLNAHLAEHGLALPNLGDIDAQTISGAISTGTHGTGATLANLATFVEGVELVTGDGSVMRVRAGDPEFPAVAVGVGALGVVTEVTLRCVPAFTLLADERPLPLAEVLRDLETLCDANDHFEFYWFPYTDRALVKRNNRVERDDAPLSRFRGWLDDEFLANTVYGGLCRLGRRVPALVPTLAKVSARALSARRYTAPSHEVFCSPRRVRFVEMEYSLPRAALRDAFGGLRSIIGSLPYPIVFPVEVRCAAADDLWLSPGYGRDSAYIAIHQYVGMPYERYFRQFEEFAYSLGGRPHWGKLNYLDADQFQAAYPRYDDFRAVRDKLDPGRVFGNAYTRRIFGD